MTRATDPGVDIPQAVAKLLTRAALAGASDLHLEPTAEGYEIRRRVDGVLEPIERTSAATGRAMVNRLMVQAQLLTYRLDIPQEGRMALELPDSSRPLDCRVAVIPAVHGLRAAVRIPSDLQRQPELRDLGLPAEVMEGLSRFAGSDAGLLLVTGPAGAGKTTTLYGLLSHLVEWHPGLSIISIEDPVERSLPGVTQIQVRPQGELTYEAALRSVLRQDPQVLVLGEVRDRATAELAVSAAMTGHRVATALHAGSTAGAVARLLDMGIEPYQVTGCLAGVVAQRLLRRRREGGGYEGRVPAAEWAEMDEGLRRVVLARGDAAAIGRAIREQATFRSLAAVAGDLVKEGVTDAAEVRRVLGDG